MGFLILKLAGPLQSWGVGSKYNWRKTADEPTKSGVVGLMAAALGRRRTEQIDDLANFNLAVRIDQSGLYERDYQTAKSRKFDAKEGKWVSGNDAWVTQRFYLADAIFLAGLEVPDARVEELVDALIHPAFPLYLGRRSCPPSQKILMESGLGPMIEKLHEVPWQATRRQLLRSNAHREKVDLPVLLDSSISYGDVLSKQITNDVPLSFSQANRLYGQRQVVRERWHVLNPYYDEQIEHHDPMELLEEGR